MSLYIQVVHYNVPFSKKIDRFAEINTLRQAQGKNKSNSQMNQINS